MKNYKRAFFACLAVDLLISFIPALSFGEGDRININKAYVKELCKLDRIGKTSAQKIIEYREKNGPFENPKDILKVKGIGTKTYEANKDSICVE